LSFEEDEWMPQFLTASWSGAQADAPVDLELPKELNAEGILGTSDGEGIFQ